MSYYKGNDVPSRELETSTQALELKPERTNSNLSFVQQWRYSGAVSSVVLDHAIEVTKNRAYRSAEIQKSSDDAKAEQILANINIHHEETMCDLRIKAFNGIVDAGAKLDDSIMNAASDIAQRVEEQKSRIENTNVDSEGADFLKSTLLTITLSRINLNQLLAEKLSEAQKASAERIFLEEA